MYGSRHDLVREFPEFERKITTLKSRNPDFSRLLAEYDGTDKKIYGIEQQMRPVSDAYVGALKRRRLVLKDRLFEILKNHRAEESRR